MPTPRYGEIASAFMLTLFVLFLSLTWHRASQNQRGCEKKYPGSHAGGGIWAASTCEMVTVVGAP